MKILVTGGAGFIGSAVVRLAVGARARSRQPRRADLRRRPRATWPRSRRARSTPSSGPTSATAPRSTGCSRAHAPDAVMHLAAESHVDRSIDGPGAFVETNVTGTYHLLEAARATGRAGAGPKASASTTSRPTRSTARSGPTGKFTEDTPYDPRSPYSASKAASDHLVRAWHETYGLPTLRDELLEQLRALPLSREAHPGGDPERAARPARSRSTARARTCATGSMSRTMPTRCCSCWRRAGSGAATTSAARTSGRTSTSCAPSAASSTTAARRPRRTTDLIEFVADRPGHDLRYAIDPARIRDELGWRPSVTVEEGLARTVDWYLAREDWWRPLLERDGALRRLGTG